MLKSLRYVEHCRQGSVPAPPPGNLRAGNIRFRYQMALSPFNVNTTVVVKSVPINFPKKTNQNPRLWLSRLFSRGDQDGAESRNSVSFLFDPPHFYDAYVTVPPSVTG